MRVEHPYQTSGQFSTKRSEKDTKGYTSVSSSRVPVADQVEISNDVKQVDDAQFSIDLVKKRIAELPEVREERVAEVRKRVAEGFKEGIDALTQILMGIVAPKNKAE